MPLSVTNNAPSAYGWSATTTDPRALQKPGGAGRIAAASYSASSFTVDVTITDGQTHDLALYVLDWDNQGRSEQIQFTSATTGAVLNTETVSSYSGGVYLQWAVSGNLVITFKTLAGPNAGFSGLFFGPASSTSSTAAVASLANQVPDLQSVGTAAYSKPIISEIGTPDLSTGQQDPLVFASNSAVADAGSHTFSIALKTKRGHSASAADTADNVSSSETDIPGQ